MYHTQRCSLSQIVSHSSKLELEYIKTETHKMAAVQLQGRWLLFTTVEEVKGTTPMVAKTKKQNLFVFIVNTAGVWKNMNDYKL